MATEVATLTFKVDTKDVERAQEELKKLGYSASQAEKKTDEFSNSTKKTADSVRKLRSTAGQLGFQVQDIAVQLQSGTNAMIVFGQQGSQIAGAFGPGGAIVGAVIAVGAAVGTAMVAAFSRGSQSAEDLLKELDELTEGFDKVGEAARVVYLRETAKQISDLEEQINETTTALERQQEELNKLNRLEVEFGTYVENSEEGLKKLTVITQDLAKAREDQQKKLAKLLEKQALLNGTQKEEDKEAKKRLEDITRYVERMKEQADTLGLNTVELAMYKAVQMGANAEQLKSIMLSAEAIKKYQEEQKRLKELEETKKRNQAEDKARAKAREADQSNLDRWFTNFYNAEGKKADAEQASIDQRAVQVAESLMSEEEQIRISYERRAQVILDSTVLTGKQVNDAMAALELERQDKLKAIKDKAAAEDRERAAQTTNQLLAFEDMLMKGKSEKQKAAYRLAVNLASAEKRENAAKIVSDSYAAAMGAYKALAGIPIIGPALGAAAAALIIGSGVSFAAKSLTGRALGGQVRDGESYIVGERGPEVLTMNGSGGRVIPNDKLRGGGGKTINQQANITFQISTVDATGFDSLLESRRGQIVNMINSALNDQGKGALA